MVGDPERPVLGESGGGAKKLRLGEEGGEYEEGARMLLVEEEATEEEEFLRLATEETKVEAEGRSVGRRETSRMVLATR